jgi:8-oxo-dGTP pyrophosphatase MutT (NUDIX family)
MKDFKKFINSVEVSLRKLPGLEAQIKMVPISRRQDFTNPIQNTNPRKSAVLILFYPDNGKIKTVLMKRATDNSVHSGQISFPGGKYENNDENLENTALREAWEEVGLESEKVNILGPLTKLFIPPSNFDVFPFVGFTSERPNFNTNREVESLIEVEINTLLNPETFTKKSISVRNETKISVPCYLIDNHIVWGATSMILSELLDVIRNSKS